MSLFIPKRAFFERDALNYPLGKNIFNNMQKLGVKIKMTSSHNRVIGIPGKTSQEAYFEGKRTLVVGVRRGLDFQTCRPSAHFQLPLVTSCIGECEYCYLNTTLGKKPYIRVYVNLGEILDKTKQYIDKRAPELTIFEGSATSDPLPVEPYTGALAKTISFFGNQKYGRFRFVTKFSNVDSLLNVEHNQHTTFRFSINTDKVISHFEHSTPSLNKRVEAASKVAKANYPIGFIIGPIFYYENYREDYTSMLKNLSTTLSDKIQHPIKFELITHRFTKKAKSNILEVFPNTQLPMVESERRFKYGQFGYGKYIYPNEIMEELKIFFYQQIKKFFPTSEILYFV